jgi:hypothetical protein
MQRIMLTYGPIIGAVIILTVIISMSASGMSSSPFIGYLIQIIAFSVIFVAVKKYRDQELGGVIKFGSAFKLGLGISLIASLVYVIVWEVYLNITDFAFISDYAKTMIEEAQAAGKSSEEVVALQEQTQMMVENYENPFFRLAITLTEVFPTGILISLIAAFVFKTKTTDTQESE